MFSLFSYTGSLVLVGPSSCESGLLFLICFSIIDGTDELHIISEAVIAIVPC